MQAADNRNTRRTRTSSADMRKRVLSAAGRVFSRTSYDEAGIREIAAMADTDPAIVMRLFGSKAALFEAVAEFAFAADDIFEGALETMGPRLASRLMALTAPLDDMDKVTSFQLMLRSAGSLTAAPILSSVMHRTLIEPLGRRIGGADGMMRAAMVTAHLHGFATLRFALASRHIDSAGRDRATEHFAKLIQLCIDG